MKPEIECKICKRKHDQKYHSDLCDVCFDPIGNYCFYPIPKSILKDLRGFKK